MKHDGMIYIPYQFIHSLLQAKGDTFLSSVKEVLKKFCALYIKMSVTCCGDVLNPEFQKIDYIFLVIDIVEYMRILLEIK